MLRYTRMYNRSTQCHVHDLFSPLSFFRVHFLHNPLLVFSSQQLSRPCDFNAPPSTQLQSSPLLGWAINMACGQSLVVGAYVRREWASLVHVYGTRLPQSLVSQMQLEEQKTTGKYIFLLFESMKSKYSNR